MAASTVFVKSLIRRVSVLLNDISPQFTRYSEREIVDHLNDGQLAIFKYLPAAGSRLDAIKLSPGTRQSIERIIPANCKPGDGTTPEVSINGTQLLDVIRNMGEDGESPGDPIRPTTRDVLDVTSRGWHSTTGLSVRSSVFNPQTPRYFYVYPGPPVGTDVWVEIAYTAQPIQIVNNGTPGHELYATNSTSEVRIGVTDEMVDDLVNYIVARCLMKAGEGSDPNRAAAFTQLFIGGINAKVAAITGNNPNLKLLPFAPDPIAAAS